MTYEALIQTLETALAEREAQVLALRTAITKLHALTQPTKPDFSTKNPAIVQMITKNPGAIARGKIGGPLGGRIRAERLSPERRREIASMGGRAAAAKRWGFKYSPEKP